MYRVDTKYEMSMRVNMEIFQQGEELFPSCGDGVLDKVQSPILLLGVAKSSRTGFCVDKGEISLIQVFMVGPDLESSIMDIGHKYVALSD